MNTPSYQERRGQLRTYFDRTAVEAWERLTSDAPVSRIRATVRAGRDQMRAMLLDWLPDDLVGLRVLDAGCGTGALAVEAARRGAEVVAVDISPTLIELARERAPSKLRGRVEFHSGDMLEAASGEFDHVVAMDSLIHYDGDDVLGVLGTLADRTRSSILFTFAPRTPALTVMHRIGKMFPRADRSPMLEPLAEERLTRSIASEPALSGWQTHRSERISSGFYKSHALELVATGAMRRTQETST